MKTKETVRADEQMKLLFLHGLLESALIEVGDDHRLADDEPLKATLRACERLEGRRME